MHTLYGVKSHALSVGDRQSTELAARVSRFNLHRGCTPARPRRTHARHEARLTLHHRFVDEYFVLTTSS